MKRHAGRVGIDPATVGGHSLRSGFASEAARRQIPTAAIRMVTGHSSDVMLSGYVRPRELFRDSAGRYFTEAE